jgi:hypothetical protein
MLSQNTKHNKIKKNDQQSKRAIDWGKIFANHLCDKGLKSPREFGV